MANYTRTPIDVRLWALVDRRGPDECWLHRSAARRWEHGTIHGEDGSKQKAHRVAFALAKGPVPAGLEVRHTCDNPPCCNPAHLILGTHAENMRDMRDRRRARGPRPRWAGTAQQNARLTEDQVRAMRAEYAAGWSMAEIAARYPVGKTRTALIVKRKAWVYVD